MKFVLLFVCIVFTVLMLIRIIEMSVQFDGIDIIWTTAFMISALITGAASTSSDDA